MVERVVLDKEGGPVFQDWERERARSWMGEIWMIVCSMLGLVVLRLGPRPPLLLLREELGLVLEEVVGD